jgi:hypothetical protein
MTWLTPARHLMPQIDARLIWFCVVLLGIDAFFIAMYSIHAIYFKFYNDRVPILGGTWDIGKDRSYAEMFGYLKALLILSVLISIPQIWKRPIYLAFIAIYAFVLVDDAFQLHEAGGLHFAEALGLQPFGGLRPRDAGELLVWTIAGIPLLAVTVFAVVRSPWEDRRNGVLLMAALAVLVSFAVVADMAHVVLRGAFWGANDVFEVIEDGGEQLTLSLTCGLAILIRRDMRGRQHQRLAPV